jgi:hypothetical protein
MPGLIITLDFKKQTVLYQFLPFQHLEFHFLFKRFLIYRKGGRERGKAGEF